MVHWRSRARAAATLPPLVWICLATGCGKPLPPAPQPLLVQTARAAALTGQNRSSQPGYIALVRAETETDFSFKVAGILELNGPELGRDWDEGSQRQAGQVLARLKPADFDNLLTAAAARARLTRETLARLTQLRSSDAISQQELDVAKADADSAKAQLAQAEQNRKDSVLLAPFDGVVLARYVNSGVTLAAGQRVLRFAKNDVMSVELGVPDRLVSHFWRGKQINVEISAFEGHAPFPGQVSEVGVAASPEGRLYRVVIKVDNRDGKIRSGMTATVRVGDEDEFSPNTVRVPLSALVTVPAGSGSVSNQLAVYVRQGGTVSRRLITTGDILESSILVTAGLKVGEEVVTSGASFLYDGAPVEVVEGAVSAP